MNINQIKPNPDNPRTISKEALVKLKASIERDPQFMRLRPIVIDENNMVLGGNQRYRACCELGLTDLPDDWVVRATDLTDEQRKRFVLIDNAPEGMSGEWDLDTLVRDWDRIELSDLGFEIPIPQTSKDSEQVPSVDKKMYSVKRD